MFWSLNLGDPKPNAPRSWVAEGGTKARRHVHTPCRRASFKPRMRTGQLTDRTCGEAASRPARSAARRHSKVTGSSPRGRDPANLVRPALASLLLMLGSLLDWCVGSIPAIKVNRF